MTGRPDDFAIVDDDAAPAGELILVGGPASNAASRRLAPRLGVDAKQLADLGPEGYRIKTATVEGRRVTLVAGGGRVGTLYGVYDLLHRLGCRWFAPGEFHEEMPRVELDPGLRRYRAAVASSAAGFYVWEDRGDPEFLLWMARNRLNYWCVEQNDQPLMRKLGIQLACGTHDAAVAVPQSRRPRIPTIIRVSPATSTSRQGSLSGERAVPGRRQPGRQALLFRGPSRMVSRWSAASAIPGIGGSGRHQLLHLQRRRRRPSS